MSSFERIEPVSAETLPILLSVASQDEFDVIGISVLLTSSRQKYNAAVRAYTTQAVIATEAQPAGTHAPKLCYERFVRSHIDSGGFLLKLVIAEDKDTDPGSVVNSLWEAVNIVQAENMPPQHQPDVMTVSRLRMDMRMAAYPHQPGRSPYHGKMGKDK